MSVTISLVVTGDSPASVALNSVVRTDTEAEVLTSPPVAMVLSGGAWSYTFAEPSAGLLYRYEYKITWSDASYQEGEGTAQGSQTATGRYASLSDLEDAYSPENIAKWSDLSNDNVLDVDRVQTALTYADAEIDLFFRDGTYTVPLNLGSAGTVKVRSWAVSIAGHWLYKNRGIRDDDKMGNILVADMAAAKQDMGMYKGGALRLDASRRWPSPTGPMAV